MVPSRRLLGLALPILAALAPGASGCNFDPSSSSPGIGGSVNDGGNGIGGRADGSSGTPDIDGTPSAPPDASGPDASPSEICAALCPGDCDESGACTVACGNGDCQGPITCPPGVPCTVLCAADGTCASGVDCSLSSSCEIDCNGDGTCQGALQCGAGPCNITCGGNGSCRGDGIDCSGSCNCVVSCTGSGACDPEATCPIHCDDGKGCTNSGGSCDPSC